MKPSRHCLWITLLAGFLATATACVSANAQSFAYVPDGVNVSVIDTGTNTVVATLSGLGSPFGVAVTPNGSFAYVTNFQGTTVSVIDRTNAVVATVPGLSGPFTIAVTPSGAFAYTGNIGNDTVSVINTTTNGVVATIPLPHGSAPVGVAILPNGSFAYVSDQGTNAVSVINTATNAVVASVPVGASPAFLASTPNGAFVYVPNFGSTTVSVISTATNSVVATVPVGNHPVGVAVRPDGAIAYVSNKDDNTISAISTATNSVLSVTPVGNGPSEVAFSADGSFAYVVNINGGTVSVLETASNTLVATIPIVSGAQTIAISAADNDSSFSQLNGGNSFNGNQTVNGQVAATSFSGNGSGLTGVNAATAMMASGLNCAGCVGNTQLSVNYAGSASQGGPASNALLLGGMAPSAFATLGTNSFIGLQYSAGGFFGVSSNGAPGIFGESGGGPAILGQSSKSTGPAGYFNVCNQCPGNSNLASLFAGGDIIDGANGGMTLFRVDYAGNVTAGSVTIGGGTPIVEYVSVTDSVTLPALTPGTCTTFTTPVVQGFTPGTSDTIALGTPASLVSSFFLQYEAWETTTTTSPTITIQVCNPTAVKYKGGATGTLRIDIFKH